VHELAPFINELISIVWDEGNDFFPATSLQVSNLNAGTGATNVIPGKASVDFNLRYCPDTTPEYIRTTIEQLAHAHNLDANFTWNDSAQPFITKPGPLTNAMERAVKKLAGVSPVLAEEVIEFGSTNATIHQIDECVDLDELTVSSAIYEHVLVELLTEGLHR